MCRIDGTGKCEMMNKERYQSVLKSHLLPFVDTQCGGRDNGFFWPDLSSSHDPTDVKTWFTSENIDFVKRENNPPVSSQLRSIEHIWPVYS